MRTNMEMDVLIVGPEETYDIWRNIGAGEEGAPLRQLMSKKMHCLSGEPLRGKSAGQILRRERAAK
eukprot:2244383-Prorocentrum_lima.AAC.1